MQANTATIGTTAGGGRAAEHGHAAEDRRAAAGRAAEHGHAARDGRAVQAYAGDQGWTAYLVPLGRLLYTALFLLALPSHLSPAAIGFAEQQGVPLAGVLVPLSGVLAFVGGLSVLLGYKAKLGAWLLVAFLVPVTLTMHTFWRIEDPMAAQLDQTMFMKNVAMLGVALLIAHVGAGPLSLDARAARRTADR